MSNQAGRAYVRKQRMAIPLETAAGSSCDRPAGRETDPDDVPAAGEAAPAGRTILPAKDVPCWYFVKGYCYRGRSCWYKHDPDLVETGRGEKSEPTGKGKEKSEGEVEAEAGETCAICFETPTTYGLLTNCDHVFCLSCIRAWRNAGGPRASSARPVWQELEVGSLHKTSKTCPLCRISSNFIIPSSIFPTPPPPDSNSKFKDKAKQSKKESGGEAGGPSERSEENAGEQEFSCPGNPAKEAIVRQYLQALKKIPCRYFKDSIDNPRPRTRRTKLIPYCPFYNDCHYAHFYPENTRYVFTDSEIERHRYRKNYERRQREEQISPSVYRQALDYVTRQFGNDHDSNPAQVFEMFMNEDIEDTWGTAGDWDAYDNPWDLPGEDEAEVEDEEDDVEDEVERMLEEQLFWDAQSDWEPDEDDMESHYPYDW